MKKLLLLLCLSFPAYADDYDEGYDDSYYGYGEWGDSDDYYDGYYAGQQARAYQNRKQAQKQYQQYLYERQQQLERQRHYERNREMYECNSWSPPCW